MAGFASRVANPFRQVGSALYNTPGWYGEGMTQIGGALAGTRMGGAAITGVTAAAIAARNPGYVAQQAMGSFASTGRGAQMITDIAATATAAKIAVEQLNRATRATASLMKAGLRSSEAKQFASALAAGVSQLSRMNVQLAKMAASAPWKMLRGGARMARGAWNIGTDIRTLMAGTALAAAPAFAARNAMSMENARYDLGRALEQHPNSAQMRNVFGGLMFSAARMPGVDLDQFMGGAVMGARQGIGEYDPSKLLTFTRDIGKMSAVFDDIDINELTTQLSRLLKLFDLAPDKVGNLASAVNKLDMISTASAQDILNISVRLSGMTSKLGFSPGDNAALATALRQSGLPIETSGTAITQILGRMADQRFLMSFSRLASHGSASEGNAGFNASSFQDLMFGRGPNKEGQDASEALRLVTVGLQQMGDKEAIQYLNRLSLDGQRVRGTLLQLGRVTDEWSKYQKAANEEMRTGASLMDSFNLKSETASAKVKQMRNNLRLMGAGMGGVFLPVIKQVADSMTDLSMDGLEWSMKSGEAIENLGKKWANSFSFFGGAISNWDETWDYIVAVIEEKTLQGEEVFKRFGKMFLNVLKDMAHNAGVLGGAIGERLSLGLTSGLVESMRGLGFDGEMPGILKRLGLDIPDEFKALLQGRAEVRQPTPMNQLDWRWDPTRDMGRAGMGVGEALFEDLPANDERLQARMRLEQALDLRRQRRDAQSGFVTLQDMIAKGQMLPSGMSNLFGTLGWAGQGVASGEDEEETPWAQRRFRPGSSAGFFQQGHLAGVRMRRRANQSFRQRQSAMRGAWSERYGAAAETEREAAKARQQAEGEGEKTMEKKADNVITLLGIIKDALVKQTGGLIPRWTEQGRS